ncbi:MAG: DUF4956 domain-containing protein [Chloroflexi bacterium]|nr:DUF4956 domain-containing protein [Chloroflexota bacterium]
MELTQTWTWGLIGDYLLRFGAAILVGVVLALHPVRLRRWGAGLNWGTVQAQILIAFAGALMVIMVGESVARAFGLVGIGTLIRFRTTLRDPRDIAVLFLLIGLGMGCGIKLYPIVALATAVVFVLLFALEIGRPPDKQGKKSKKREAGEIALGRDIEAAKA